MLFRWLNPFLFLGAAAFIYAYDSHHTARQYVLPGLQALVGDDMRAQGRLTWQIITGVGVILLIWAIVEQARAGTHRDEPPRDA